MAQENYRDASSRDPFYPLPRDSLFLSCRFERACIAERDAFVYTRAEANTIISIYIKLTFLIFIMLSRAVAKSKLPLYRN